MMSRNVILLISAIIAWQIILLIAILTLWYNSCFSCHEKRLFFECTYIAALAGILYCLRALYVRVGLKEWNPQWTIWYFLRPITSSISGFVSCIFLHAGILALGASGCSDTSPNFGFWAFAFIAGYNVDRFMKKVESTAKEMWGIQESRSYNNEDFQDKGKEGE